MNKAQVSEYIKVFLPSQKQAANKQTNKQTNKTKQNKTNTTKTKTNQTPKNFFRGRSFQSGFFLIQFSLSDAKDLE